MILCHEIVNWVIPAAHIPTVKTSMPELCNKFEWWILCSPVSSFWHIPSPVPRLSKKTGWSVVNSHCHSPLAVSCHCCSPLWWTILAVQPTDRSCGVIRAGQAEGRSPGSWRRLAYIRSVTLAPSWVEIQKRYRAEGCPASRWISSAPHRNQKVFRVSINTLHVTSWQ